MLGMFRDEFQVNTTDKSIGDRPADKKQKTREFKQRVYPDQQASEFKQRVAPDQ